MKICRFAVGSAVHLGVIERSDLIDLTSLNPKIFADLNSLHRYARRKRGSIAKVVSDLSKTGRRSRLDTSRLLIPVVPAEIWGAGITYLRSRLARETETKTKGIYDYVYTSVRPEIFLKDTGLRCVGPGDEICVRSDSNWSVPEPELAVVLDGKGEVVGYTVGDDVSARDVEGENPLFLPQAKIYRGSSALGPVIATPEEIRDPHHLEIEMRIIRSRKTVFKGGVNTSRMKRKIRELVDYLRKDNVLKDFTVLMTGTAIVPPDDFTLKQGDRVEIEIEKIGTLINPVRKLR